MQQPTKPKVNSKTTDQWQSIRFKLAFAILLIYILFMAYLVISKIEISETYWGRLIFLFSGIEALVFTAVGFVFGREINRKSEQLADKMTKDAEKQKEKAEKEKKAADHKKERAEKEAKNNKIRLTKLQEAVITEKQTINQIQGGSPVQLKNITGSSANQNNRALELALKYQAAEDTLVVSFSYEIEAENFSSIMIDGDMKDSKTGYFASVYPYGKTIDVLVDRDNFDTWKFTAKGITDQDGRPMEMVNSPLESNSSKSSFQIKYP